MTDQLLCPKCKTPLEAKIKDEVEVDGCAGCEGVWVQHADEKQVLQIKPQSFSVDELRSLRDMYEPAAKREKVQYVPCPVCQNMMTRRNWGSHSGVIVDKCKNHGTWYDKGEVEKIQEFIDHGGIEYEKMRMTEKTARRLENKLQKETHRLDMKAESMYRRARIFSILGF